MTYMTDILLCVEHRESLLCVSVLPPGCDRRLLQTRGFHGLSTMTRLEHRLAVGHKEEHKEPFNNMNHLRPISASKLFMIRAELRGYGPPY